MKSIELQTGHYWSGLDVLVCWILDKLGQYYDVAVRDIVMAIGAFCLHIMMRNEN